MNQLQTEMRGILQAIERALKAGESPAMILDENSPIRDGIRTAIANATGVTSSDCWCGPEVDYVDPVTGVKVYVHRAPKQPLLTEEDWQAVADRCACIVSGRLKAAVDERIAMALCKTVAEPVAKKPRKKPLKSTA
jgi:hypothetical protein